MRRVTFVVVALMATLWPVAARAALVDPQAEALNLLVSQGREREFSTPRMVARVASRIATYHATQLEAIEDDPERAPNPNTCTAVLPCPIDPRFDKWTSRGGIVREVLFTIRSGATLSGHVWATRSGPAKRPGAVIINGSILAIEEFYWYAAQTLAKAGYLVLTFDAQGEGMSDQFGEGPDQLEGAFAATPGTGRELGGNGEAFYDGGQDALDFFLSTPSDPYVPPASRGTHTSHAAKQERRVLAGLNAAYNPLWRMLDRSRIGIAGNSYGAEAASWIGQKDPHVKAIVAWDNLCIPVWPSKTETKAFAEDYAGLVQAGELGGSGPILTRIPKDCFGALEGPAPAVTKPSLGISNDYFLTPAPFVTVPDPHGRSLASLEVSRAGVDSGEIVIRGGTHVDAPNVATGWVPATLRGKDIIAWYTTAWFDKYVKGDRSADARLRTNRWRDDQAGRAEDPGKDGNMLSWHFRSRLDIGRKSGERFDCEDLRAGCPGLVEARDDCGPSGSYSALATATAPDGERADRRESCAELSAKVTPKRFAAGRKVTLRVAVTKDSEPLADATVRLGSLKAKTNSAGIARLRARINTPGLRSIVVRAAGISPITVRVRVRRR